MGITVLGPVTVNGSGRLSPRDRVVLQALATRPGRPVSADELMDALWGDQPPPSAVKILQGCIVRLRKELGTDAIETAPQGYTLRLAADHVDALRFERVVVRARELLTLGEADRVAYQLTEALASWTGAAFAELPDWAPAVTEAQRLDELRLEAEELRVDAHLRSGRHREVLAEAQTLVRNAPLRERRWTLLALAQYQAGNQGEALRTIHQLKSVLLNQLGIDPGPDVDALEQAILRQDASLLSGGVVGVSASSCPWQGLRAYDVDDAERFFGRDDDVAACLDIVGRTSFLALVGPSGSGKSSILRAGVAAALRRRGRPIITITPGRRPLESLSALDRAPKTAVLSVDQGEEMFSLCEDPDERRDFLRVLTEQAQLRPVLVAIRADRLADVAGQAAFSRLVERGLYLVGALDHDGLRQAVEGPARQAGLIIEPGLVDLLVREVQDDPGALPLLSHALLETWKRREGNTLTVAGYQATGGIRDAVAQSAERLYARIDTQNRPLLRDLVLRLVSPGTQGEPVRSRVPRRLIATDTEHDRLIEMLVGARLVTSDDGVLEVTHEALARAWPRLRGWLDDDIEGQRTRHHLSAAADAWNTLNRPDSELYRGVRLTRALDWQSRTESTLTDTEREFLSASRSASDAEERSAAERARAQARLIRRLRIVLTGAVALLVLALAAGGIAAVQSNRANENAAQAEQSAISALARGAAALGTASGDLDTELLLAAAGVVLDESPETLGNLQRVTSQNPALIGSTPVVSEDTYALDVLPDGRTAALLDNAHSLSLVDLATGAELARRQIGRARSESDPRRILRVSPDGRLIAVGAASLSDRLLYVLDAQTLNPVTPQPTGLPQGSGQLMDAQFSQDGSSLAVVAGRLPRGVDAYVGVPQRMRGVRAYVWSLGSSAKPSAIDLTGWTKTWASAALSPDGRLLYTATPTVRVHDLRSGGVRTLSAQGATKYEVGLEVSPDGRLLVLARGDLGTDAVLLDADTGRVRHTLRHDTATFDARFSSDGRRVLTVTLQPTGVAVWDTRGGRRISQFAIPTGEPNAVDLLGVGERVISATPGQGQLRHWDVDGESRYLRRVPVDGLPWGLSSVGGSCFATPSADGAYVAYALCPRGVRGVMMDVARRRAHPASTAEDGYSFGGGNWYAPRAEFLRAIGGTIYVWDGRTGRVRAGPHPVGDRVTEVDHSPDGSRVVISELAGTLTLLDGVTLEPVGQPTDVGANVCCVALGPDNRTAFALLGGPARNHVWFDPSDRWALVDLEDGEVVKEGSLGLGNGIWAAYSPDGRHVAAGGLGGDVAIIDTETGELVREPVRAHSSGVFWLTFSSDGSQLASSTTDGSVVLWDAATGNVTGRVTLSAGSPSHNSTAFLPNGNVMIVPFSRDPAVYVWDPSARRAVEFACRAAGRDLTEAEWAEHFPGQPFRSVCPQN